MEPKQLGGVPLPEHFLKGQLLGLYFLPFSQAGSEILGGGEDFRPWQ